jgi:hypothetical protein
VLRPERPVVPQGIWWSPRIIGRGFRLKARRFRLVTTPHPRRAQTPSRSLPLSVHARRSRFRGALSTKASLLPPGAFGLSPLLHDDSPRIAVPLTPAPNASSKSVTAGGRYPVQMPGLRLPTAVINQNTGSAPKLRRARLRFPSRTWRAAPKPSVTTTHSNAIARSSTHNQKIIAP